MEPNKKIRRSLITKTSLIALLGSALFFVHVLAQAKSAASKNAPALLSLPSDIPQLEFPSTLDLRSYTVSSSIRALRAAPCNGDGALCNELKKYVEVSILSIHHASTACEGWDGLAKDPKNPLAFIAAAHAEWDCRHKIPKDLTPWMLPFLLKKAPWVPDFAGQARKGKAIALNVKKSWAERRYGYEMWWGALKSLGDKPHVIHVLAQEISKDQRWLKRQKTQPEKVAAACELNSDASYYTRTLWTLERTADALSALSKIQKVTERWCPDGSLAFVKARIYEEQNKPDLAMKAYFETLSNKQVPSNVKVDVEWRLAWMQYKNGELNDAQDRMGALAKEEKGTSAEKRDLYWQARCYAMTDPSKAKDVWSKLWSDDPTGYYGMLSARALDQPLTALKKKDAPDLKKYLNDDGLGLWLIATRDPWGPLYLESKRAQLLDPVPYFNSFVKASLISGVSPYLLAAIAQQESTFNPHVVSIANAYGLMQILPERARQMLGRSMEERDLFDPTTNAKAGALLFRRLLDRFSGTAIFAIASYNAGENAVSRWLSDRFRADPTEWIEEIPFQETRNYVKLVLRNYINLMRTQSSDPIPFPVELLAPLQQASNP